MGNPTLFLTGADNTGYNWGPLSFRYETDWNLVSETRFVYDGMLPIQERDRHNVPTVTYTRGTDLSGTLQGAGGIGGVLARTDHSSITPTHAFYHADGNGNVTMLINQQQVPVANYSYDSFGNTLVKFGPLAEANTYRFSAKEIHPSSGLYYYGFRFYDPNLQRWLNRDPLNEQPTRIHDYSFIKNAPLTFFDLWGLMGVTPQPYPYIPDHDFIQECLNDALKELKQCQDCVAEDYREALDNLGGHFDTCQAGCMAMPRLVMKIACHLGCRAAFTAAWTAVNAFYGGQKLGCIAQGAAGSAACLGGTPPL